jgi:2-amino-4-hydroxy-6-hydroxymethyldihydropteridine diphosphokinase
MRDAIARLERVEGVKLLERSRVYETAPVGGPPQPSFLNAAICVECTMSPRALLSELLRIERELGRVRGAGEVRFGPRLLDLDVLWIDGVVLDEPSLVVPHPRVHERAFALVPLLEVAPDAIDPRSGARFSAGLAPPAEGVVPTSLVL